MVIVIILIERNCGADRHLALFSAVFVTIQLMEFFAWLSIERKDRHLNGLVTRLILVCLWAQPLINSYMAMKGATSQAGKYTMAVFVAVFAVLMLGAVVMAFKDGVSSKVMKSDLFTTTTGPNCHLMWKRRVKCANGQTKPANGFMANHTALSAIYLIGLFVPILFVKPFKKGLLLALLGFFLLVLARQASSKEEFGSWWCWVAAVFVIVALIYKTPNDPEYESC